MTKYLIQATGPGIAQANQDQLANMALCAQTLARDPRIVELNGISTRSLGIVALAEVESLEQAQEIAALAQVAGFSQAEVTPLVPSQQLSLGIAQAARQAGLPQAQQGSEL